MKSFNKAIVMGNVVKAPELRKLSNGQQVTDFFVATNRTWNNAENEKQEAAEFHKVVVWGKLAALCVERLAKGSPTLVEGRLQADNNGKTEIIAQEVSFL